MTKGRVLVVDDEERIRTIYRRWLVRAGYDVLEASSGNEAIQVLFAESHIKLVITDRVMPMGSGEDVIRVIRATWPTISVVVVTGFGDDLRTTVPVISKPVNGPTLIEAVERALAG